MKSLHSPVAESEVHPTVQWPGIEKGTPTVKVDRYGDTSDEVEDTTRYHFAKASVLLRTLADTATNLFVEGRPLCEDELRQIHNDLNQVWHIVVSETFDGILPGNASTEPRDLEDHHSLYSDGSLVTTVNLGDTDLMRSVPTHFRER